MRIFEVKEWEEFAEEFDCKECANDCVGCSGPEGLYLMLREEGNHLNGTYKAGNMPESCVNGCDILRKASVCYGKNQETGKTKDLVVLLPEGEVGIVHACNHLSVDGLCSAYETRPGICRSKECE